jgi:hypothetical protein
VALRWQDMDERQDTINDRQGVSQKSRHDFVFGPAKSDGAERRVKLTELKLSALGAQREQQEAQQTRNRGWWAAVDSNHVPPRCLALNLDLQSRDPAKFPGVIRRDRRLNGAISPSPGSSKAGRR